VPFDIAFFGSSLVSSYWNGAATYYRGIVRAMAARGHRVTFYEPDAYERQQHRDIPDPPWAKVVVYAAEPSQVRAALAQAAGAQVIIKASGVGVFDAWLEENVVDLRTLTHGRERRVIFWDVDAPATLDRVNGAPSDPFRALIPAYDAVFTYGGGTPVVDAYLRLGARACVPIYNALDPATHFPEPADPRFRGCLGFLGNRLPDREKRVEEFFLGPAAAHPAETFVLGGAGWEDKRMPANVRHVGHVYTRDHNRFNASARAILNVNRESMARYGHSPATRLFEAAGAGACLITDAFAGIERFLEPDREVLIANDGSEVSRHLDRLTPERARAIGAAARARVLTEHTYDHRVAEVEDVLNRLLLEDEAGDIDAATAGGCA